MSSNFATFGLLLKFCLLAIFRVEFKYERFTRNLSIYLKLRLILVFLHLLSLCEHSSKSGLLIVTLYYMSKFHVCSREIYNSFMEKKVNNKTQTENIAASGNRTESHYPKSS